MRSLINLTLCLALLLGACAISPNASYVASNDALDNAVIARASADFLHSQMPAAQSTVTIDPVNDGNANLLTFLSDDLRDRGFAVAVPGSGTAGTTDVRLLVTPYAQGFAVVIDFGGRQAASYFGRDNGGQLVADAPFVLREVGSAAE